VLVRSIRRILAAWPVWCRASAPAATPAEQAILDRDAHWNAVLAAHDLDGVVGMYSPDASLMPPNAPRVEGEALRATWKAMLGAPGMKLVLKPEVVTVAVSGDLATDRGSYVLNIDGAPEDRGKYVVVWKKVGGEWKAFQDIFNSDLPAAKPAE
jgi:ketosteroid isomerase-like protein